jgi:hypothetical protein
LFLPRAKKYRQKKAPTRGAIGILPGDWMVHAIFIAVLQILNYLKADCLAGINIKQLLIKI